MKKCFKIFGTAICAISAAATLASCSALQDFNWKFWEREEEPSGDGKPTQLLAPELSANDNGIFWTQVAYAEGYKIKLGGGEWQTLQADERSFEFPDATGSYSFSVVATANGITESAAASISFDVKQASASVAQTDNVLTFTGDNIYYSVNGGEEGALGESQRIDFGAAAVGTEYSVEYYTKGGYWVESEKAYYIDGEKQTATLTVTAALSSPVLEVNAKGTGLTWSAVENGGGYEVTVDGVTTTVSQTDERKVDFPTTVGTHTITVKALENGNYKTSQPSAYEMTTVGAATPQATYDQARGKITWDKKYAGLMTSSVGGAYSAVSGTEISYQTGLKLKISQYYDETNGILYLASKTLSVETRQAPQITFLKEGKISWNPDDEGAAKNYYVSLTESGAEDSFAAMKTNEMDVASYAADEYSLKVYGTNYVDENETAATLYLPSEASGISFKVLAAPKLTFTTGKLLWTSDGSVTGYEVSVDGADWDEAAKAGEYEASAFATYSVRAIGNEAQGSYTVNSQTVSLTFDPTLKEGADSWDIANFNDGKYLQNVGASREGNTTSGGIQSVITTGETAAEQAILDGANGGVLKLTASNAAPRNTNTWGNFDGICFNFFKPISGAKGGKILVRVYMTSNPNRAYLGEEDDTTDTVGGWQAEKTGETDGNGYSVYERKPADIEGRVTYELHRANGTSYNFWKKTITVDGWTEILMDVPSEWATEEITGFSLNFHENGQEGNPGQFTDLF